MGRAAWCVGSARVILAFVAFICVLLLGGGAQTVLAEDERDSSEVALDTSTGETTNGSNGNQTNGTENGKTPAPAPSTDPCKHLTDDEDTNKADAVCAEFTPTCPSVCAKTSASGYKRDQYMTFVEQKVRLYYFTNVVELMYALNPGTVEINYPGQGKTAEQVQAELLEKECRYSLAVEDETIKKNKLIEAERTASDTDRAYTTTKANLAAAQQDPAYVDASNEGHAAAEKLVEKLEGDKTELNTKKGETDEALETAKKEYEAAASALVTARLAIELERELATTRFGLARDYGPLYAAYGNAECEDPLLRVTLVGFPDNMQIIIRGLCDDVRKVVAIIKEVDSPAPQARLTLWTLELSSDTSQASNERMNRALMEIEEEFAGCREEISAVLSLLRDTITSKVYEETNEYFPKLDANHPFRRFLIYDYAVLHRLGFNVEETVPFDSFDDLGLEPEEDTPRWRKFIRYNKYHSSEDDGSNDWKEYVFTRYIIPDPTDISSLSEALVVLTLMKAEHRYKVMDAFEQRLTQHLSNRKLKADDIDCYHMHRLRRIIDADFCSTEPISNDTSVDIISCTHMLNGNQQLIVKALQRSALERFLPASVIMIDEMYYQIFDLSFLLMKEWNTPLIKDAMIYGEQSYYWVDTTNTKANNINSAQQHIIDLGSNYFENYDSSYEEQGLDLTNLLLVELSTLDSVKYEKFLATCIENLEEFRDTAYDHLKKSSRISTELLDAVDTADEILHAYNSYIAYSNNDDHLMEWLYREFDLSWASISTLRESANHVHRSFYAPTETEPDIAQADELLKRMNQAMEDEIDEYFVRPMLNRLREKMLKLKLGVGVIQRTGILATNRMVARVDPRASAQLEMVTEEDYLEGFKQLISVLDEVQNQDEYTSENYALARQLVNFHNTDRTEIYGITSGNLFKVTPVFDPSGEALRFKLDYNYSTRITDPGGASGGPHANLPRIEKHDINTEVQLSNFEIREVSRFESNAAIGIPPLRTGGIPFIKEDPLFKDIPFIGYFTRREGRSAVVQQSLIFAQTTMYPSITDIVRAMTTPIPDIADLLAENAGFLQSYSPYSPLPQETGYILAWKVDQEKSNIPGTVYSVAPDNSGLQQLPFFFQNCSTELQEKLLVLVETRKETDPIPVIVVSYTVHRQGEGCGYAVSLSYEGSMLIPVPKKKQQQDTTGQASSVAISSFRQYSYDHETSASLEEMLLEQGLIVAKTKDKDDKQDDSSKPKKEGDDAK